MNSDTSAHFDHLAMAQTVAKHGINHDAAQTHALIAIAESLQILAGQAMAPQDAPPASEPTCTHGQTAEELCGRFPDHRDIDELRRKARAYDEIERIVGVKRHVASHIARAVSARGTVYILHSHACLESGIDLRDCEFSIALGRGIDPEPWRGVVDRPVRVQVTNGRLLPDRQGAEGCDGDE